MPTTTPVKLAPAPPAPLVLSILPSAFSNTGFHWSRCVAKENVVAWTIGVDLEVHRCARARRERRRKQ